MRTISQAAVKTLEVLTQNLKAGQARKIDLTDGTFMAVHVEHLTENTFSVAHYFLQNGDLCADPDMTFHRTADGAWMPTSITQWAGFRPAMTFNSDGSIKGFYTGTYNDCLSFASMWMRNIKAQQGGLKALRAATV